MNANITRSPRWSVVRAIPHGGWLLMLAVVTVINNVILGANEENGFVIIGCLAAVLGTLFGFTFIDVDDTWMISKNAVKRNWGHLVTVPFFFLLSFIIPYSHLADSNNKVWMADGKTTLGTGVLIKSPFSPLATSIMMKRDGGWQFQAKLKNGQTVTGHISGTFRLTDDEKELLAAVGTAKDPDVTIADGLRATMDKAFSDAMAKMDVADLSRSNNFALEVDVGTALAIRELGLKRNGTITVSDIHPYFVDK